MIESYNFIIVRGLLVYGHAQKFCSVGSPLFPSPIMEEENFLFVCKFISAFLSIYIYVSVDFSFE